jgi:hypothetical protein
MISSPRVMGQLHGETVGSMLRIDQGSALTAADGGPSALPLTCGLLWIDRQQRSGGVG